MEQIISLVRTSIRSELNINLGEEKRGKKIISVAAFVIFCIACMEVSFVKSFNMLHSSNSDILVFKLIINVWLIISAIWIFKQIITTFYLASDWKEMTIYPIKPGGLLLSKCIRCCLGNSIVSIFVLVFLFSYGFLAHISAYYYLHVILFQIIITAVPTAYFTLITLTIFWVTAVIRNPRSNYKSNKWLIVIDLVVGVLTYFLIKDAMNNHISVGNLITYTFFGANLDKALGIEILITLSIIIIVGLAVYFLGDVYSTIMKSDLFNSRRSKEVELESNLYEFKPKNIVISNIIRDIKLLMRIPALRFNCITFNAFSSLFGIILLIAFRKQIISIRPIIERQMDFFIVIWFLTLQIANVTMITSFSREGRALNQFKVYPVEIRDILLSKISVGLLSNVFPFVSTNILLFLVSPSFISFVLNEFIIIIYLVGITIIQIELDVSSMELKWMDIKELFCIERAIKIMKPYFILTLIPIVVIILGSFIFHGKWARYINTICIVFAMVFYSLHSFRKIMIKMR